MIDDALQALYTLGDVHDLLRQRRPAEAAPLQVWQDYLRMSAKAYAEIADVDRRHHHEALARAGSNREAADELAARIGTG